MALGLPFLFIVKYWKNMGITFLYILVDLVDFYYLFLNLFLIKG